MYQKYPYANLSLLKIIKKKDEMIEETKKQIKDFGGTVYYLNLKCDNEEEKKTDKDEASDSKSKAYCGETKSSPSSFDECKNMDLREGKSYCCHFSSKVQILGDVSEVSQCQPLSLEDYLKKDEMIKEMKKQLEDFGGKVFYLDLKCDNEEEKKTDKDEASHSKSKAYCGEDYSSPSSFDACKNMDLREGKSYCCYLSYKFELLGNVSEVSQCKPLSLEEYSKKDKMIEETKKLIEGLGGSVSPKNLKCGNGDGKGEGEDGRETIPERTCSSDCHGENIIKSNYIISSIFVLALILF